MWECMRPRNLEENKRKHREEMLGYIGRTAIGHHLIIDIESVDVENNTVTGVDRHTGKVVTAKLWERINFIVKGEQR